jgi:hypothetical protein
MRIGQVVHRLSLDWPMIESPSAATEAQACSPRLTGSVRTRLPVAA